MKLPKRPRWMRGRRWRTAEKVARVRNEAKDKRRRREANGHEDPRSH